MTDPSKKVYNSIHEALLDYARLGKKTYDEMKPNEKPSWENAPDWANSLGICNFDVEYKGEWCWCGGTNPSGFICVEQRPELEELK